MSGHLVLPLFPAVRAANMPPSPASSEDACEDRQRAAAPLGQAVLHYTVVTPLPSPAVRYLVMTMMMAIVHRVSVA